MKDLLITLGLGIVLSCALGSLLYWLSGTKEEESNFGVGCAGVRPGIMGVDKRDFKIPPMNAADGAVNHGYATDVLSGSAPTNVRYPVNGVW